MAKTGTPSFRNFRIQLTGHESSLARKIKSLVLISGQSRDRISS